MAKQEQIAGVGIAHRGVNIPGSESTQSGR